MPAVSGREGRPRGGAVERRGRAEDDGLRHGAGSQLREKDLESLHEHQHGVAHRARDVDQEQDMVRGGGAARLPVEREGALAPLGPPADSEGAFHSREGEAYRGAALHDKGPLADRGGVFHEERVVKRQAERVPNGDVNRHVERVLEAKEGGRRFSSQEGEGREGVDRADGGRGKEGPKGDLPLAAGAEALDADRGPRNNPVDAAGGVSLGAGGARHLVVDGVGGDDRGSQDDGRPVRRHPLGLHAVQDGPRGEGDVDQHGALISGRESRLPRCRAVARGHKQDREIRPRRRVRVGGVGNSSLALRGRALVGRALIGLAPVRACRVKLSIPNPAPRNHAP